MDLGKYLDMGLTSPSQKLSQSVVRFFRRRPRIAESSVFFAYLFAALIFVADELKTGNAVPGKLTYHVMLSDACCQIYQ